MKSYISEIMQRGDKTCALPIPFKYREGLHYLRELNLKTEEDESEAELIGYKTIYLPEPKLEDSRGQIERIACALSELSEEQVKSIGALCHAFDLPFCSIMGILVYIEKEH